MRRKEENIFCDIDNKANGLLTNLTYVVLFLNDQAYNYAMRLLDDIKKTKYYRQGAKMTVNEIYRRTSKYNIYVNSLTPKGKESLAIITASMEEDVIHYIEIYKHTVSQVLLKHNICGDRNHLVSLSSTINMLAQMSRATIVDIESFTRNKFGVYSKMPPYMSMDNVEKLSREFSNYIITERVKIDLNAHPEILLAFKGISNNLLRHEVFEKAYKEDELYKEEMKQYEE
jgi:hypothetical protein